MYDLGDILKPDTELHQQSISDLLAQKTEDMSENELIWRKIMFGE